MKKKYLWLSVSIIAYLYVCILTFQIGKNYMGILLYGDMSMIIKELIPTILNLIVCWFGHYSSTTLGKKLLKEIVDEKRKDK